MLTQLKIHAMAAGRLELETGRLQDAGMFEKAVALYEPINAYKPIADGIGTVDGPLVSMAYPGFPFLSIPFPTRMTVVRLGDGALWLHSPVAYDEGLARDLSEKGRIAHLVSPNLIHYAHIGEWSKRFPEAEVWASPRVRERARAQGFDIRFDAELGRDAPAAWASELAQTLIPGKFVSEVVFFHEASRTLILADTIQNFELDKLRQPYRSLVWLARAYAPRGQMPIDLRSTFFPRRREVRAAVRELLAWRPERIVISHGKCIDGNAVEALEWAFRWAL